MRVLNLILMSSLAACNGDGPALQNGEVAFESFATMPDVYPAAMALRASPDGSAVALWLGEGVYVRQASGEWTDAGPGGLSTFAVSDAGTAFVPTADGLLRTTVDGTSQLADLDLEVASDGRGYGVVTGADGSVWASGRSPSTQGFEVWTSNDDGVTWSPSTVRSMEVAGGAQITSAFYVREDGVLFSASGGDSVRTSTDGQTWTDVTAPPQPFNGDRFGIPRVNHLGQFVRFDATQVQIYDAQDDTYVVIPRDSLPISASNGSLSGAPVVRDGTVYWMLDLVVADAQLGQQGGDIQAFDGSTWSLYARVPAGRVYSGTSLALSDGALVSGTGFFGLAEVSGDGSVRTEGPAMASLGPMGAQNITPVDDGVVLVSGAGITTPPVTVQQPGLMAVDANGSATLLGIEATDAIVTSNGTVIAYDSGVLRVSSDGGRSFAAPVPAPPPDPQGLGNVMSSQTIRSVQVGDSVYLRIGTARSGVSGPYGEWHYLRLNLDGELLETLDSFVQPALTTFLPDVTGADGGIGYRLQPPVSNSLDQVLPAEHYLQETAGSVEALYDGPMPVAGSRSGTFVAMDATGLSVATERDLTDFEPAQATLDGGGTFVLPALSVGIDGLLPPWFDNTEPLVTWPAARFDADGRLYVADEGVVYRSTGTF